MNTQESAEDFMDYGRVDWYVTATGARLHYVKPEEFRPDHRELMESNWSVPIAVRLACGRMASGVWIPGIFTRQSAERCQGCCRATGLPYGTGSPKNDDACREVMGL